MHVAGQVVPDALHLVPETSSFLAESRPESQVRVPRELLSDTPAFGCVCQSTGQATSVYETLTPLMSTPG